MCQATEGNQDRGGAAKDLPVQPDRRRKPVAAARPKPRQSE
jgi:hypothetical protein